MTPEGEKLLVTDKTQSMYGIANAWKEEKMRSAGFLGRRIELKTTIAYFLVLFLFDEIMLKPFYIKRKLAAPKAYTREYRSRIG